MDRNTLFAVILSTVFLVFWWTFFQPKPAPKQSVVVTQPAALESAKARSDKAVEAKPVNTSGGKEVVFETKNYRAVFTTKGAAVKEWWIKGKEVKPVNLALTAESSFLSTFPELNFSVSRRGSDVIIFEAVTSKGLRVRKTYTLSDDFLNTLDIDISGKSSEAFTLALGPGMGTDEKELKENEGQMRALTLSAGSDNKSELQALKPGEYPTDDLKWASIDNRYFLSSVILRDDNDFDSILVRKASKKAPPEILLSKKNPSNERISLQFYLGPKGYSALKTYKLGLEEAVDFGIFGFLGKMALAALVFFHKLTGNYGWAIILLTLALQILVYPLSLKSFKATAAMKKVQPKMKAIQEKYKSDPKRMNIEVMNLYKAEGVNPLGGCLPMILQLPIFWALFTTLRNAYELRGAPWVLWIHDLSVADRFFSDLLHLPFTVGLLPILMGLGMLVQQKMSSATSDPTQAMMMYMMPLVFMFMFMGFPAGLVLYWLVNSIMTMIEMYFIMHRPEQKAKRAAARTA